MHQRYPFIPFLCLRHYIWIIVNPLLLIIKVFCRCYFQSLCFSGNCIWWYWYSHWFMAPSPYMEHVLHNKVSFPLLFSLLFVWESEEYTCLWVSSIFRSFMLTWGQFFPFLSYRSFEIETDQRGLAHIWNAYWFY
jgi:hypothetical protein